MKAAKYVVDFAAKSQPIKGLEGIDVAHNIGATANAVVKALTILRDNMRTDLTELFTRSENTPTPTVIAYLAYICSDLHERQCSHRID